MKKSTRKLILSLRHARQVSSKPSKMDRPYADPAWVVGDVSHLFPRRYYQVKFGASEYAFFGFPPVELRTSLVLPEFQAAMKIKSKQDN